MDALLEREALHFKPSQHNACTPDRRLRLVEDVRALVGRAYPCDDAGEVGGDFHDVLGKAVACLDRILASRAAGSFLGTDAFPMACLLLASKFVKSEVPRLSDAARLSGVGEDEMAKVELYAFFFAGLGVFAVTAHDYLAELRADIPEEHARGVAGRLLKSLFRVPYTLHPPSVVAAAALHASLPEALLGLDADTGLARFLRGMVGRREDVLRLAGELK